MAQLHGVETIELLSGTMAVTTIQTAIIGIAGTAPAASVAIPASVVTGTLLLDNVLELYALEPGSDGNQIRVSAVNGDERVTETVLTNNEQGQMIIVLADDATASRVANVINAGAGGVTVSANATGEGRVQPFDVQLSGGEDDAFPLNVPVAVTRQAQIKQLGNEGSLPQAIREISDQRTALLVVVRAEASHDVSKESEAVINAIRALSTAGTVTSYIPRILIAPGYSEQDAVAKTLESVAAKLRAVTYIDSAPGASLQDVVTRRQQFGSRCELLRPRVLLTGISGHQFLRPYSALAAGLRARIDAENGWWWSKSNQEVFSILGVEQVDEFIAGEEVCDANLLNMQNVSTLIRRAGFRHWGNRLCSNDPQWHFESVRRTADVIEDSIQATMLNYVDRPLDRENADDIIGTINAYLRQLVALKAIFGGEAWLDEELNTAETLAAGVLYINYDFGPKSPTEKISLRVRVNNNYALEEMVGP